MKIDVRSIHEYWRITLRKPTFFYILISAAIIISCNGDNEPNSAPTFLKDIATGPFEIGFRTIHVHDPSRIYYADTTNENYKDGRPIDIILWYPAQIREKSNSMLYKEYVHELADDSTSCINDFQELIKNYGQFDDTDDISHIADSLLLISTLCFRDTGFKPGKYPLIIVTGSLPLAHTALCEYLATYGYVIASIARIGIREREPLPYSPEGVQTMIADLKYVTETLSAYSNIDTDNIGLAAWSFEGAAQLCYAMRNKNVKAVVSLDAATGYKYGRDILLQIPGSGLSQFTAPFIHMTGSVIDEMKSFDIYNSINNSLKYFLTVESLHHVEFTSINTNVIFSMSEAKRNASRAIFSYTLNFFEGYLINDMKSLEYLRRDPAENNFAPGFIIIRSN